MQENENELKRLVVTDPGKSPLWSKGGVGISTKPRMIPNSHEPRGLGLGLGVIEEANRKQKITVEEANQQKEWKGGVKFEI